MSNNMKRKADIGTICRFSFRVVVFHFITP
nr:MAG TPA: hypothetical protein [Caudoviricetes sp.]